jgi:hypothetical protein
MVRIGTPNSPGASAAPQPSVNPPPVFQAGDGMHQVQPRDTLSAIAERNNMGLKDLIRANPQIKDPNCIEENDLVRLPGGGAQGSAPQIYGDAFEITADPRTPAQAGEEAGSGGRAASVAATAAGVAGAASTAAGALAPKMAQAMPFRPETQWVGNLGKASKALTALGGATAAVDQALNGHASTTAGQIVNGGLAGATNILFSVATPGLAAADSVLGVLGGPSVGQTLKTSNDALVTLAEGVITGDELPADRLHQGSLRGDNGAPAQAIAVAGEAYATDGVGKTLSDFKYELTQLWD